MGNLKRALAATALSFSAIFNVAAQDGAPISAPVRAVAPTVSAFASLLPEMNKHLRRVARGEGFNPGADATTRDLATRFERVIQEMGTPSTLNHIPDDGGYQMMSLSGLSPFQAGLVAATAMNRPDIVRLMLERGGDPLAHTAHGWSAMDIALFEFGVAQRISRTRMETSLKTIKVLVDHGVTPESAASLAKMMMDEHFGTDGFFHFSSNPMALGGLRDAGLITDGAFRSRLFGPPTLAEKLNRDTLSRGDLRAMGAKMVDFPDAFPGGPEPYAVREGDTFDSLAERFFRVMGKNSSAEALQAILAENGESADDGGRPVRALGEGEVILIPVPKHIQLEPAEVERNAETFSELVGRLSDFVYDRDKSVFRLGIEAALINGEPASRIHSQTALKKGERVLFPFVNDSHTQHRPLPPPSQNAGREVDLIVIEGEDVSNKTDTYEHAKTIYRLINGMSYAWDEGIQPYQNVHYWDKLLLNYPGNGQDALKAFMGYNAGILSDRVMFTHSMVESRSGSRADAERNIRDGDHPDYINVRMMLEHIDHGAPIVFSAAGNAFMTDGYYIQSFPAIHSPRAVIVGATGLHPRTAPTITSLSIAPYGSYGADICDRLPRHIMKQVSGTSFSTPLFAARFRHMASLYGDRLGFSEILAASVMTASQDFEDYVNPAAYLFKRGNFEYISQMKPAEFRTNGAGIPHNARCGAGTANPEAWQQALEWMLKIKSDAGLSLKEEGVSHVLTLDLSSPQRVRHESGQIEYIYQAIVPEDMVLGRQTFFLPQEKNRRSDIVVRTPAGFELHLEKAYSDIISKNAFAYETVRAGDAIEIRTNEPLAVGAGMILRGYAPDGAIARLRDALRAEGKLYTPLQDLRIANGQKHTRTSPPLNVLNAPPRGPRP